MIRYGRWHKTDCKGNKSFKEKQFLFKKTLVLLIHFPGNKFRHTYPDDIGRQRNKSIKTFLPISVSEGKHHHYQIRRLCIGKNLSPKAKSIAPVKAAGKHEECKKPQFFHNPVISFRLQSALLSYPILCLTIS